MHLGKSQEFKKQHVKKKPSNANKPLDAVH